MENDEFFYTLAGYQKKNHSILTHAMEDYLEMCYRIFIKKGQIQVKELAKSLHVKASSVTKMMERLKGLGLVDFQKYGIISLKSDGIYYGKYLLERHDILVRFLKKLNGDDYTLEQVEKIEHFVDFITIQNIQDFLEKKNFFE